MIPAVDSKLLPPLAIPDTALFWARWVPRLLLFSAVLVILARVAAPFQAGMDQAQQLEAAQRLVDGQGITNTSHPRPSGFDIAPDQDAVLLTQWPPGLSIAIAALLGCGLSLVTSLKLLYSVSTALGWLGWAWVCGKVFLEAPATGSSRVLRAVPLIAATLVPVFYSPQWKGTDVFLWAGVPWVTLLTNRLAGSPGSAQAAAAGLLAGALFALRYAGAFLPLAAGVIIFWAAMPNWKELLKRYAAFGVSSLLLAVPVLLFMKSGPVYIPLGGMYESGLVSSEIITVARNSYLTSIMIFGSPVPEWVLGRVDWPLIAYAAGVLSVLAILIAPVLRWNASPREKESLALPLLILPAVLVVFLIVVSRGFFLGVPRYYEPVQLCWVLVCIILCGSQRAVIAWGARGILTVFLAYLCVAMPLRAAIKSQRPNIIRIVLGYSPSKAPNLNSTSAPVSFPSYGLLFSAKEDTRRTIVELFQKHPDALFLVQGYPLYVFDGLPGGPKPGSQVRPFPLESYWTSAFSSIDRRLFVVLDADEAPAEPRKWVRKVVYRNPWEKTVICEIDIKTGQRALDAALAMPADGN